MGTAEAAPGRFGTGIDAGFDLRETRAGKAGEDGLEDRNCQMADGLWLPYSPKFNSAVVAHYAVPLW